MNGPPHSPGKPAWDREGRDWPNRAASRFVAAGGLVWHVQVMGAGPVVLLLHGTGAASHSWRDVAPALARTATVAAVDLPGHAFTQTPPASGYTLPAMATGVAALMEVLELVPDIIVGHSAGAAIALRMALDAREPPHGVVALNGALRPFPGLAAHVFPTMARLLFLNPWTPHMFAMRARDKHAIDGLIRQTGSALDAVGIDLYRRLFAAPGHVAATLGMMANWDLRPLMRDFADLRATVRVAHGERDGAVPLAEARVAAARIPNAEFVVWPGLGHLAHEEAPAQAVQFIAKTLAGLGHRARA